MRAFLNTFFSTPIMTSTCVELHDFRGLDKKNKDFLLLTSHLVIL